LEGKKRLRANRRIWRICTHAGVTRARSPVHSTGGTGLWFSALRKAVACAARPRARARIGAQTRRGKAHRRRDTNYVVGNLPWGIKIAGFHRGLGGKRKGQAIPQRGGHGSGDGKPAGTRRSAGVFMSSERRYDESLQHRARLIPHYPGVLLASKKGASFTRRRPHSEDEERVYRKIWARAGRPIIPTRTIEIADRMTGAICARQEGLQRPRRMT